MVVRRSLGRQFRWLWAAYAASVFGTWLAFDAFALIAILVLHVGPTEVSVLAAAGLAGGRGVRVAARGIGTGRRRFGGGMRCRTGHAPCADVFGFWAGQRGELQHAQGLPPQFAHGGFGLSSANEPPCVTRTGHGVPI